MYWVGLRSEGRKTEAEEPGGGAIFKEKLKSGRLVGFVRIRVMSAIFIGLTWRGRNMPPAAA
jgi:hypothetical protein